MDLIMAVLNIMALHLVLLVLPDYLFNGILNNA